MLNAQETKIQVGDIFDTNNCGKLVVLEYKGHLDVIVKFIDTGYETTARANNLRKGNVKDRSLPSVYGVGVIGNGIAKVCGVETKDYKLWKDVMMRSIQTNTRHIKTAWYLITLNTSRTSKSGVINR